MHCVLFTPCRVVLPGCSAGWRKNSRRGVSREIPGRSTSSLQSQGNVHISDHLHTYRSLALPSSFSAIKVSFLHIHPGHRTLLFQKEDAYKQLSTVAAISIPEKKIETSLTIASDWHLMMLTKMAKSFLTALRPHQHFFPLCRYQRLFRPTFSLQKSLLSAHFCHVRGWVSGSRGRKGVSPSECCMLSWPRAESVASLPFYFAPSFLTPPPLLELWSERLCCLFRRCGCEGNTKQHPGPQPAAPATTTC